jgi:hypothetical protein
MQSRLMSLVEALTNIVVGFWLAVLTQMLVFPIFGLQVTFLENLTIGGLFTGLSLIRAYVLRRMFAGFAFRASSVQTASHGEAATPRATGARSF